MRPAVETPRRRVSTNAAFAPSGLLLCAIAAMAALAACGDDGGSAVPTAVPTGADGAPLTKITFVNKDGTQVDMLVEIADSLDERTRGLMFRESLPEDQGMLFVHEQETLAAFWMKDTLIPLSVAFIEGEGEIVDIQDMEPLSEELHTPAEEYLYAVEANQGWFADNGIGVGSGVRIARTAGSPTTPIY